jgi:hypothetical protein
MGGRVLWAGLKNMAPVPISPTWCRSGLTVVGGGLPRRRCEAVELNVGASTQALLGEVFTDGLDRPWGCLTLPGRDGPRLTP